MGNRSLRPLFLTLAVFAGVLATPGAGADNASPVGLWKSIDDQSGKPRSLIRISENNGELQGRIEKVFPMPGEDPNPKCDQCQDARKDQPIIGMLFMTGLRKDGNEYAGGQILDPDNGKVYRSKMELSDGGKKLSVRGFIGISLFGRSQTWLRME